MELLELGKLQRIDPRDVWRHEALDFTPWLVEHIDVLGEVLGLELEVVGREHDVGVFAVDIKARDVGRNKTVIIENQLEQTDHTHLGQIITYAAGLEAGVVIWISREIREEHRKALDWLNRGESATTEYFGVVLELLQIECRYFRGVACGQLGVGASLWRALGVGVVGGKALLSYCGIQTGID